MSDCLDSKLTNVFGVRTIDDIKAIGAFIKKNDPKICALIGGGLTCLEMAESLHHFGIKSHIIEMAPMLLPNQLAEMGSKYYQIFPPLTHHQGFHQGFGRKRCHGPHQHQNKRFIEKC